MQPATAPVSVEIDLHPDAAGDDNANLNDEWVRFTNTGAVPCPDLAGWTVRDESSSNRYTFPPNSSYNRARPSPCSPGVVPRRRPSVTGVVPTRKRRGACGTRR